MLNRFLALFLIVLLGSVGFADAKFFYGAGGVPGSSLFVSASAVTGAGITAGSGFLNAGKTYTITLTMSGNATIAGGTPSMTMNEGDTATYQSGSGTTSLAFTATVGASANTSKLAVASFNFNGATIVNGSVAANMTGALNPLPGTLVIITTPPAVLTVSATPATASLITGQTASLAVAFTNPVLVTGTPTMCLNSSGTAIYSSGSGTSTLTFNYTILGGQSSPKLAPCASNAIALNGGTIRDQATNSAVLSGANGYNMAGTLQINESTSGPTCSSSGTQYYVSKANPVGSDSGPGTLTAPFLTLAKVYSLSLGPNDCVNLNSVDAQCQGFINGFQLTVQSCSVGTIHVNDPVAQLNANGVGLETQVVSQTSGTTGGAGVYTVRSWQSTGQIAGSSGSPLTLVFGQVWTVGGQQDGQDNACVTFNRHNVPSGGGGNLVIKSYGGGQAAVAGSSACANTANFWPLVAIDGITGFTWSGINVYVSGFQIAWGVSITDTYDGSTITGNFENSAVVGANTPNNNGGDTMGQLILLGCCNNAPRLAITVSGNVVLGGFTPQTGISDDGIVESNNANGTGNIIEGNVCANVGGHGVSQNTGACIGTASNNTIVRWNHVSHNAANALNYCGGMSGIENYNGGGNFGVHIYQNEIDFTQPVGTTGSGFCDDEAIDLDGGTNNALVEQNYTHDNYGPAWSGIAAATPWGGNVWRFNLSVHDYTSGYGNGYFAAYFFDNKGNNFYSGPIYFYNNTLYEDPTTGGTAILAFNSEIPPSSIFANNLLSTNSNGIMVACNGGTPQASVRANSHWYSDGYFNQSNPGTVAICGSGSLAAWQAVIPGGDAGAKTTNPNWLGPVPPNPTTCETGAFPPGLIGPQPCPVGFGLTSASTGYRNAGTNVSGFVGGSMGTTDYQGNLLSGPNGIPIGAIQ